MIALTVRTQPALTTRQGVRNQRHSGSRTDTYECVQPFYRLMSYVMNCWFQCNRLHVAKSRVIRIIYIIFKSHKKCLARIEQRIDHSSLISSVSGGTVCDVMNWQYVFENGLLLSAVDAVKLSIFWVSNRLLIMLCHAEADLHGCECLVYVI
jgi:hypothetical protein